MEAITYIRGRSIPNAIILIDEAQNLSKEEIKTILTRAGENTKVILTGDIEQIDNSSLDATSNGLTHVIEKFKNSDLAGHITFTVGERSRLASEAADIL
jgi:PhoH-like ATPase